MQAYCMKCRAKKEIKNPQSITLKNGRPATQGVCPGCGTKVFRIGKGQAYANAPFTLYLDIFLGLVTVGEHKVAQLLGNFPE